MAPTIVLRAGKPVLIVGASGGPRIISAILQTMINVLDFRMPLDKAVKAARIHHQWKPNRLFVEPGIAGTVRTSLGRKGHVIKEKKHLAVVQAILVTAEGTSSAGGSTKRKITGDDLTGCGKTLLSGFERAITLLMDHTKETTGCSKRSSSKAAGSEAPGAYMQVGEEAERPRTPLVAFFSILLRCERVLQQDGLLATRSYRNKNDLGFQDFLEPANVAAGVNG